MSRYAYYVLVNLLFADNRRILGPKRAQTPFRTVGTVVVGSLRSLLVLGWLAAFALMQARSAENADAASPFTIDWRDQYLSIGGDRLRGREVSVWYLEAYCRPNSTNRDWKETVIGHRTKLVETSPDRQRVRLQCKLNDGTTVDHDIRAVADGVEFRLKAHNPTAVESSAHWAQPCIRVDRFTGRTKETYLEKCFVFLDDKLTRLPTPHWATQARYVPGQVWRPRHVSRRDVNPRPLSADIPSNGLIGCFSADEKMILATAWEPYQELFQGVIVCLHADFRIGGLKPGESKSIHGKIYLVDANVSALLHKYARDFPEHTPGR